MVLNKIILKICFYFHILLLVKESSCIIIFPFKTLDNSSQNIDSNSKEYNSTHFLNENFEKLIYTNIRIGNPSQEVNTIITYNDCNFKIGKARKCVYTSEYLSHYNRNSSNTFNYTDYYTFSLNEFEGNKGCSAEETVYAFTDLYLKNYTGFPNIGFYLGSDTNDTLCGVIGLRILNFATFCSESNNIIESFKSVDAINNYQWILNYTSEKEGMLIIGANISELVPDFKEELLYKTYSIMGGSMYPWTVKISKIECGPNNKTINYNEANGELNNDYSVIIGSNSYYVYIEDNFFYEYQKLNICYRNIIDYGNENNKYYVIECNKEKFTNNDIEKFPILSFRMRSFEKKFIFEGKDLFTETKYKYFFNMIFSSSWKENWIFGKIFMKKYPISFDLNNKIIQIYNNYNKKESESDTNNGNNINDDKVNLSGKFITLMILIVLILICFFSALFYFIGKNINKLRKKKANELNDEYDYTSAEENKAINSIPCS